MLPLIKAAQEKNLAVLVMNPNLHSDPKSKVFDSDLIFCRNLSHIAIQWSLIQNLYGESMLHQQKTSQICTSSLIQQVELVLLQFRKRLLTNSTRGRQRLL